LRLYPPDAAIEQALFLIIAQAHQLVIDHGQRLTIAQQFTQTPVILTPRFVHAHQNLIGPGDHIRMNVGTANDVCLAIAAIIERLACAHLHGQANNGVVRRLAMHLCQHNIGFGLGEKAATAHGGQLCGVAQHQHRLAKGEEVAAKVGIDHRTFVNDDKIGFGGGGLFIEHKIRFFGVGVARGINHRMDGARIGAALVFQHQGRLAGEGTKDDIAIEISGNMLGQCGFARASIAKQPEHRRILAVKPAGYSLQRRILLGRPGQIQSESREQEENLYTKRGSCGMNYCPMQIDTVVKIIDDLCAVLGKISI